MSNEDSANTEPNQNDEPDHSHDAGNPDRKVEPAPPTDQPKGDTESRVEHPGGGDQLSPDEVKREQGKD